MKIVVFFLLSISFCCSTYARTKDVVFSKLYRVMDSNDYYMNEKEQKINDIKRQLNVPKISKEQLYSINQNLYNEYKTFIADSAIGYVEENLKIAYDLKDTYKINESRLNLASLYSIYGMYIDSQKLLEGINRKYLSRELLIEYYDICKSMYSNYSINNIKKKEYKAISDIYRDSLLSVLDTKGSHYKIVMAEKMGDSGEFSKARDLLENMFEKSKREDHEKAVIAYAIATIDEQQGNIEEGKKYYAISAICDIKNAIKENASLKDLAIVLYKTGDIEHAYRCIKFSMRDALFCNARLRFFEISQILPIIDTAYQNKIIKQKDDFKWSLYMISLLSVFLIIAVIYVYKQMKRVAFIRKELYRTNVKLKELNENLEKKNTQLGGLNNDLKEANRIKETYIGHFMDLCSAYITKLEKFKNDINKKVLEKNFNNLSRILSSSDMIDREIKEFNNNFDTIFIHLYPNFVEEFNALLLPDEQLKLKQGEILNTELRIFALIRLGITDSSRIASFLHYSSNTIYNYRTRVRNKSAVPRDQFEYMVSKLCSD